MITLIIFAVLALVSAFVMYKATFGKIKAQNKKTFGWIGIIASFLILVMAVLAVFGKSAEDILSPDKDPFGDKPMFNKGNGEKAK